MHVPDAVHALVRDLTRLFGPRLQSLVVHAPADGDAVPPTPTLVLVERLTVEDLRACADRVEAWHEDGLATPLIIPAQEFSRSLDAFPLEFGAIIADHVVVAGADPFAGLQIDRGHLRQACELQARSHLLHLREGFLESGARADHVAALIVESAAPLAALLRSILRLRDAAAPDARAAARDVARAIGVEGDVLEQVVSLRRADGLAGDEARRLLPAYLDAVERLVAAVDQWPS
jgi:hypothetical protein